MNDADSVYRSLFNKATGYDPYEYQVRLALADEFPELAEIPTGLGKTAAIVLAWLYRRRRSDATTRKQTPRRLVYCLPMRTLVDQTVTVVQEWLKNLGLDKEIQVHVLMGGENATDWDLYPEKDAILIGTQDMLLSRALNRGYAMSRYRWPMQFGLLNNDCLWVFDEVQLMGSGLATTAQLRAFQTGGKQSPGFGCFSDCRFLWMSATIQPQWLDTVDHPAPSQRPVALSSGEKEARTSEIGKRLHAVKRLRQSENALDKKPIALAREILAAHQAASEGEADPVMTLVVVNRVDHAVALWGELRRVVAKEGFSEEPILIHSRFRPLDRKNQIERLLSTRPPEGHLVVATQVVEAGVDISAKVLFTELGPWPSLVQRFGRCNRKGEYDDASVFWIDVAENDASPYTPEGLRDARSLLQDKALESVGPAALEAFMERQPAETTDRLFAHRFRHVIRRKDLLELFDTTPDLAGSEIDISRYIRDDEEHDVQVFWREIAQGASPDRDSARPARREELCSVPVGKFRDFLKDNRGRVWRWDALDSLWVAAEWENVFPGQVFFIAADAGGYSPEGGWDGKSGTVEPVPAVEEAQRSEGNDDDHGSEVGVWQSLEQHTDEVCRKLDAIVAQLSKNLPVDALRSAARWHDRGKTHAVFQDRILDERDDGPRPLQWRDRRDLAKAPGKNARTGDPGWWKPRYQRRHFRHELASALAVLQWPNAEVPPAIRDLVAYLVAAHHGKVRLSIRSLPEEFHPPKDSQRFARGVWDGDALPPTVLGASMSAPDVTLDLEVMELGLTEDGRPSWAERMLRLRDSPDLGPFRLAYLEALLRAADRRASAEAEQAKGDQ